MNIYWCHCYDDNCGLYIVAKTRGAAKALFAVIIGEPFTDIRCELYRKNVDEKNEGEIDLGDSRLKKYDLYYYDLEKGEEIQ